MRGVRDHLDHLLTYKEMLFVLHSSSGGEASSMSLVIVISIQLSSMHMNVWSLQCMHYGSDGLQKISVSVDSATRPAYHPAMCNWGRYSNINWVWQAPVYK